MQGSGITVGETAIPDRSELDIRKQPHQRHAGKNSFTKPAS